MAGRKEINIGLIAQKFNSICSTFQSCNGTLKTIQMTYIDGTAEVWNTPSAADYIDRCCADFNDFINQFNTNYSDGFAQLAEAINRLAVSEGALTVNPPAVPLLQTLARGWTAQSEQFNVPDNYAAFANDKLTVRVNELNELVENIQSAIDAIVTEGLSGAFCTNLRTGFENLKNSAKAVADEYNSRRAREAVEEDTAIAALKSTT